MNNKVKKLTVMAMLAAMSIVLIAVIHFPIFPIAPFLEYDPADIPIFIATFIFGPVSGLILTAVVCVLQGLTVSSGSGIIGILMHFFATGGFVLVAGSIYKRKRNMKSAVVALIAGSFTMTITMVLWNLVFTPIFMGTPLDAVLDIMVPAIIPFNLIKAGVNSAITFLTYKSIEKIIFKFVQR